jgi:hypothetical protein
MSPMQSTLYTMLYIAAKIYGKKIDRYASWRKRTGRPAQPKQKNQKGASTRLHMKTGGSAAPNRARRTRFDPPAPVAHPDQIPLSLVSFPLAKPKPSLNTPVVVRIPRLP